MKLRTSRACAPLVVALLLAGCAVPAGMPTAPAANPAGAAGRTPAKAASDRGALIGVGETNVAAAPAAPMARPGVIGERADLESRDGAMMAPGATVAPVARASAPPLTGAEADAMPAGRSQVSASDLKAGAVDDNKGFKAYLEYLAEFDWKGVVMAPRKMDVSKRKVLTVVDADGKPVHDAEVQVTAFPAPAQQGPGEGPVMELLVPSITLLRTYADGRALYHPQGGGTGKVEVKATKGDMVGTATLAEGADTLTVKLPAPVARTGAGAPLDVAFVIDATGSMGGEIRKFQATMGSIAERIKMLPQAPKVRFALVSYRDQREAYVTKVENFTSAIGEFQARLDEVSAAGGGDKPEDMEAALADTVNTLGWTAKDAVRLSFVVADAAPHTDYEQSTPYTASLAKAAAAGIKFYPIGASSLEKEGEYVMRQLAQWTMGQYLFVTRGGDEASGGGGTASAEVDKFKEGRLDDIVVDIVKAELSHLGQ